MTNEPMFTLAELDAAVKREADLLFLAKSGWGTARLLAIQYGAASSERAADEALAVLAKHPEAAR